MDALKIAFYDLTKYTVVSKVNTGDKTLDNLWITLILATIAYFNFSQLKRIFIACKFRITRWYKKDKKTELTSENIDYYTDQLNNLDPTKLKEFTWNWDTVVCHNLCTYITTSYPQKFIVPVVDYTWNFLNAYCNNQKLIESVRLEKGIRPIYVSDKGIVGLRHKNTADLLYTICSTSVEVEKEFIELLKSYNTVAKDKNDESKEKQRIYLSENGIVRACNYLYSDRCFDMFISSYKPTILSMLKNFVQMNSDAPKTLKQQYGSYNLGFILHGEPGTGKTSLIKCVCNYLKRDAFVVDMRQIQTRDAFVDLFTRNGGLKNFVFVFEEFDCVQGVFNREEANYKSEIESLNDSYRTLLSVANKESSTKLEEELSHIKEKIRKLENALTIDTILTVLDGMIEHRNRVIIATTNHIDKIDPALIREGRFDLKIKLERFNNDEVHELLSKYFADEDLSYLSGKEFSKQYTPVQLINLCRQHDNLKSVVDFLTNKT